MSLTSAMYTGVSGLLSNAQALNVIGNNISNVNTTGFKSGRTIFADMLSNMYMLDSQIGTGSQLQAVSDIFSQGSAQQTANVTDLSIAGSSFFALKEPSSPNPTTQQDALLTRAGAFSVDDQGYLVNPAGFQVLDTDGEAIKFDANTGDDATAFSKIVRIDANGLITFLAKDGVHQLYYNGNGDAAVATDQPEPTVRLAVVSASNPAVLRKVGGSLYKSVPSAGVPSDPFSGAANTPNATSERVISNSLEASNVDIANEFVNMIMTQRAYSGCSKTITTTDQMTQEVLGLIR